ncbi:MAG: response regulator transcription factor [Candidatus Obscuribacterales bacterium]|nr:response regulator transcription factor [Candidatus Obscuribacterales bacterium]
MGNILVAEDDKLLRNTIVDALTTEGHTITAAQNGSDAIALCSIGNFDLLILDWNLPERPGIDVCKSYRQAGKAEPILFLTSRSDINDKESAFASGADDYLTKPFQLRELLVRVKALLRRPIALIEDTIPIADAIFDPKAGTIKRIDTIAKLQPREAELLAFFLKRPNQVIRADAVMAAVWGADFEGSEVALRACLAKVRKALGNFGLEKSIETVHGFGYQFKTPSQSK